MILDVPRVRKDVSCCSNGMLLLCLSVAIYFADTVDKIAIVIVIKQMKLATIGQIEMFWCLKIWFWLL